MSNDIRYLLRSQDPEDRKEGIKLLVRSNHPQAMEYVRRLYENDPDPDVRDLAAKAQQRLQQMQQQAAQQEPQFMDDPYADYDYAGDDKAKRAKRGEVIDDVGAGRAILDLVIMFVLVAFVVFGLIFVPTQILASAGEVVSAQAFSDPALSGDLSEFSPEDITVVFDLLRSVGTTFAIVYGLIAATAFIVVNLVFFAMIHFVSTVILSGVGGFAGLIHRMTLPVIISFLVPFGFAFITVLLLANAVVGAGAAAAAATTSAEAELAMEQALFQLLDLSNIIGVVQLVVTIGILFWYAFVIGRNYNFGTGKGCVSLILTYVLFAVIGCGCAFVFSNLVVGQLDGAINATFDQIQLTLEGAIFLVR